MKSPYPKTLAVGCLLLASAFLLPAAVTPGTVYLVIGSDTAVWNVPGGVDTAQYHGHFVPDLYILPQENGYQVMDPAFRSRFVDSFGQQVKLTWWMLVGSVYLQAPNTDVPIPNLMPLYLMKKYHGAAIQQFGDELTLHYHTFFWSDYDGDGKYWWNEARTFHECRTDFDFALAQSLLEEEVFPITFRSGWHYMDNEWQSYLNLLLPFSMHNDSPNLGLDNTEPYGNVYDWTKATLAFIPYHPSTTNYQLAGDGIGWNVRSVKMPNVTQGMMNQIFKAAAGGTDQVASLWAHLPESAFLSNIATMDTFAHQAATNYPTVKFRYCTGVEAMQRWLRTTDLVPPELSVSQHLQGENVTLSLSTSEPIFQPQPFVAVKDRCEQYQIVPCSQTGANSWDVSLPVGLHDLVKVAIAVTDLAGNLTTRIIRYLPDDLFLDNLDPEYSEPAGNWSTTTNHAWGIDARLALLGASDTARAQWSLPVSNSGPYRILVQVPAITNAAGNIHYNVYSGGSNVLSVFFAASLPAKQWIYLGAPLLDQSVPNYLEMVVTGAGQSNAFAVADVVKLSPLVAEAGSIQNIQVDPSVTTANITWTSLTPAPTLVEYGPDLNYGTFSATNSLLVTNHVMTLKGLASNTHYYFQIDPSAGGTPCTARSSFTTTKPASNFVGTLLLDLTNVWKFSTTNLERVPWQGGGYNDSDWASGPGVLWTDTKYSNGNPVIQFLPLHTQLPTNRSSAHPFVTYYFRTHFICTNNLEGTTLTFSNYIDDGAAFFLNGLEINRAFLPIGASNSTYATNYNCVSGDATCPYVFSLSGSDLTNVAYGDNVLAVEVHNLTAGSPDITFGSALSLGQPSAVLPKLNVLTSENFITFYWNGSGFTLQQTSHLGTSPTGWVDVPGPVTSSPYTIKNTRASPPTRFYRIRGP